ncbi:adenylyltransferase and sulfurtransferase [Sphingobacterium nematocida]|uniref:Adenylyltransferase and sulfurtransferase n=1 Tax=Sphingobacterium nematocida TaxID=1513896 RepID=A0A1T5DYN1_9SPHI|nr:HesA/MoeB/ThiF family protein [Sphingobacterium nematocida]SKB76745.1 adenylyltransferase and sulfurtransferase [Sphingobacterium nematocida]
MKLTKEQILRYKKQISFPPIGIQGQTQICQSRVLVIGAGGLGAPSLMYLAAAGVGTLACIDFDRVEIHNLHRQIIHREKNISVPKVFSAMEAILALNSTVNFEAIDEKITEDNIDDYVAQYDVVLDGTDNFTSRYAINDACVRQNKPLIYGTVLNFELQLAVFNLQGSKHLRDLFPLPPDPDQVPNCELNGVLNTVPGILGLMMAQEALAVITGRPSLKNQLLILRTDTWSLNKISF